MIEREDVVCPICESILEKEEKVLMKFLFCRNGCYKKYRGLTTIKIKIFGHSYSYRKYDLYNSSDEPACLIKKNIEDDISYWREDSRYLLEILRVGKDNER